MMLVFEEFELVPVEEKYAWRICDFVTINAERLKRWFPKTLEQNLTPTLSEIYVGQKQKAIQTKEEFVFILKEIETRDLVGLFIIKFIDWKSKQAELAYCIGGSFEGRNLSTEAVKTLTNYCFEEFGLETLKIITHESNTASIRVAEKSGFQFIRVLAKSFAPPGESALDMQLYERTSK